MAEPPAAHHAHHHQHGLLGNLLVGAGLVTAVVVATPFLMYGADAIGLVDINAVGSGAEMAHRWISSLCGSGTATGLAAKSGAILSHVPLIGAELAKGGLMNALVSGTIGIGGRILGNYINKNDDGSSSIRWGNVIKTACLITSLLVASPAIFTAISMGITAIGFGTGIAQNLGAEGLLQFKHLAGFFGSTGNLTTSGTLGALGAVGPHLVSCVAPLAAIGVSGLTGKDKDKSAAQGFAERELARRQQAQSLPLTGQYPVLF